MIKRITNMEKNVIRLNEEQLNTLIMESDIRVLNESENDEGLFGNIRAAYQGAKRGVKAQRSLDRGTEGFKQQHDHDDVMKSMKNPMGKMDNTAEEQARRLYDQYKEYQQQANKLLNMYNKMIKAYGLQKQEVGRHVNPNPTPASPVPDVSQMRGNGRSFGRKVRASRNPSTGGLWGGSNAE